MGQLQHRHERGAERRAVGGAKVADRGVIGVMVGAKEAHGHVAVSGRLNRARAKPTGGVTVYEQGQHHGGRVLLAARAAMVDVKVAQRDLLHGIQNEMDDVPDRQPVAQIARQEHRRVAVQIDETCRHGCWSRTTPLLFKLFSNTFSP